MSEDTRGPERWLWHELEHLLLPEELARLQAGYRERSRAANKRSEARNRRRWLWGAEKNLRAARAHGDSASAERYEEHAQRHRNWLKKYGFSEEAVEIEGELER